VKEKNIAPKLVVSEDKRVGVPSPMDLIKVALGEIQRRAQEMPAEEFFEHLDDLVESSRRFIDSFDDDETRGRLREVYRGIIRYALDCKIKAGAVNWN